MRLPLPAWLLDAIRRGVPLLVVSPHLDDAVLSCGALMTWASASTEVTVLTLFTAGRPPPYTLSARRYLHLMGERDARVLYAERRANDRAVLGRIGAGWVHGGLTEALFRLRPGRAPRPLIGRVLPELDHIYPVYRLHITSGRIRPEDAGTVRAARDLIRRQAGRSGTLVLAPLGVGRNVDHVVARAAAGQSGLAAGYYSDFPYNRDSGPDEAFVRRHDLVTVTWPEGLAAKAGLIRGYRSQLHSLFPDGRIPLVPEQYLFARGRLAGRDVAGRDVAGEGP